MPWGRSQAAPCFVQEQQIELVTPGLPDWARSYKDKTFLQEVKVYMQSVCLWCTELYIGKRTCRMTLKGMSLHEKYRKMRKGEDIFLFFYLGFRSFLWCFRCSWDVYFAILVNDITSNTVFRLYNKWLCCWLNCLLQGYSKNTRSQHIA